MTIYLKEEGRGEVSFVFDDDRNQEIPDDVTLYYRNKDDEEEAIGKVREVLETLWVYGDKNFLHNATREPIDFVENLKNKIYIKQSELAGGNDPQPPQVHPGLNEINNLVVGNEYEFVIQRPRQTQQHIYRGTLIHSPHQNVQDPTLKIINYTIDGVAQDGIRTFPDSWVIRIAEPLQQESPEPLGGGKKKKAKKTKKAKKMKKTKSKKAKKTGRKSIRRRR